MQPGGCVPFKKELSSTLNPERLTRNLKFRKETLYEILITHKEKLFIYNQTRCIFKIN